MRRNPLAFVAAAVLVLAGLAFAQRAAEPRAAAVKTDVQRARNLGKAHFERGELAVARAQFASVIAAGVATAEDYLNLGIAQMRLGEYDRALGSLTTAQHMRPGMIAADYNLGLLYKRELRYPDAEAAFGRVLRADTRDAATWFNLAGVLVSESKLEKAADAYQHVLALGFARAPNFYVASLFRLFSTLNRLRRTEEAQKYLKLNEQYRTKVPDVSLLPEALENGRYGGIVVPTKIRPAAVESIGLVDVTAAAGFRRHAAVPPEDDALARYASSLTVSDHDGDGIPDVWVIVPGGQVRVWRGNAKGSFTDTTARLGIAGAGDAVAAYFADYDNSGRQSLFLVGRGGVTLFRNRGKGGFAREAAGFEPHAGEVATSAVFFDMDNDGALDLLVGIAPEKPATTALSARLYRNNGDGTFADVTRAAGLERPLGAVRQVLFGEFNNDLYPDLLLVRDGQPPLLCLNLGEGKFAAPAEVGGAAMRADVADLDLDGDLDLVLWTAAGPSVLLQRGDARFAAMPDVPRIAAPKPLLAPGVVADLNGDGYPDLLARDAAGAWHFLAGQAGRLEEMPATFPRESPAFTSLVAARLTDPSKAELIGSDAAGDVHVWRNHRLRARAREIALEGEKSNRDGRGGTLEIKAGDLYRRVLVTQSPMRVFVGGRAKVDVVRMTWPTGIVQNALDARPGRKLRLEESERIASSCPLLYAWDGRSYVYVTDVLGASPIGELAPDGSVMSGTPDELVRLPAEVQPQRGRYEFRFTDEMREVDYFDRVRLWVVDHEADTAIYADEKYPGAAELGLYAVRGRRAPLDARDDAGADVLPRLQRRDSVYVGGFTRSRIPGLANLHTLTLDLGAGTEQRAVLWLSGWVFWPDSNSSRALSSQPTQMIGPYVQVRDASGAWVTVIAEMGVPSGTDRAMRVDLTGKFLSADRHVRIVTNLCVYWDEIFWTADETPVRDWAELAPVSALLRYRGFSTPVIDADRTRPERFDHAKLDTAAPWDPVAGTYTRYGSVLPLVGAADDQSVVMAPGDELRVEFDAAALSAMPAGRKRTLFLHLSGWAKDNEPNTRAGRSSGPLPLRRMASYPYAPHEYPPTPEFERYVQEYQTRPGYRLIPPLATRPDSAAR